jgi:hypothetical protein
MSPYQLALSVSSFDEHPEYQAECIALQLVANGNTIAGTLHTFRYALLTHEHEIIARENIHPSELDIFACQTRCWSFRHCVSEFVLIDPRMQAKAVINYVKDWEPEEILFWMSHYGRIAVGFHLRRQNYPALFFFESYHGGFVQFHFDEHEKLKFGFPAEVYR